MESTFKLGPTTGQFGDIPSTIGTYVDALIDDVHNNKVGGVRHGVGGDVHFAAAYVEISVPARKLGSTVPGYPPIFGGAYKRYIMLIVGLFVGDMVGADVLGDMLGLLVVGAIDGPCVGDLVGARVGEVVGLFDEKGVPLSQMQMKCLRRLQAPSASESQRGSV